MLGRPLRANSLAVFYRSLAAMSTSGVRIDRALHLLSKQEDDPNMAHVCHSLEHMVNNGNSLSISMGNFPDVFSTLELRLIQVGEMTGNIDRIFERLANYEESRRRVTMRVKSALTYPAFIFIVALAALIFLPTYVFGGLFKLIENFGTKIPMITQIVLVFARIVSNPIFMLSVVVGAVAVARFGPALLKQPSIQRRLTRTGLRLPGVGNALRIIAITRFARALEIMLNCGVSMDQSVTLAFAACGNPILQQRQSIALERLKAGDSIRDALHACKFFTYGFLSMVSVGEESGKLPTLLARIAQMYEVELDYTLDTLVAALEPAVLLIMGILVGFFIIATMLPMMQVIRTL